LGHRPVFGQIQWMGKRRQFSPKLLRHAHVLDIKLLISRRYSINIWNIYIMYMYTYIYTHMYIYMSICEKHMNCVLLASAQDYGLLRPGLLQSWRYQDADIASYGNHGTKKRHIKTYFYGSIWFIYTIRTLPRLCNQPLVYEHTNISLMYTYMY
jgi:hypothetical protein